MKIASAARSSNGVKGPGQIVAISIYPRSRRGGRRQAYREIPAFGIRQELHQVRAAHCHRPRAQARPQSAVLRHAVDQHAVRRFARALGPRRPLPLAPFARLPLAAAPASASLTIKTRSAETAGPLTTISTSI